jgi:hypothetical protein
MVMVAVAFAISAPAAVSAPDQSPDVHFGQQQVGTTSAPVLVTITNSAGPDLNVTGFEIGGANPGAFAVVADANDTCTGQLLATGGNCTVDVTFSPGSAAPLAATLLMDSDSATSPDLVANLDGTGTPAPAPGISVAPASPFNFGNQKVGTTGSQDFTVTNNGNATLNITSVSAGGDFSVPGGTDGCSGTAVPAGNSCQVTVNFQPSITGAEVGQLSISSNELAPFVEELDGTGTVPQAVPEAAVAFATPLNVAQAMNITLTNEGNAPLVVTGAQLTGSSDAAFSRIVNQGTCGGAVLQNGDSCSTRIQFLPTANGFYNGAVQFTDDDGGVPGSVQQVQLTGTVLLPGIDANPNSVAFGSVTSGRITNSTTVTVKNTGQANLQVNNISIAGTNSTNYVLRSQTCTGGPIAPGSTCTVNVRFAPHGVGQRVATLAVSNNAGGALEVALTGTGLHPPDATGARAAAGCTDVSLAWTNPDSPGFSRMVLVRNRSRYPRSPSDGTVVRHHGPAVIDTAPSQFHTYYYRLFAIYNSYNGDFQVRSLGVEMKARLGRICRPRNGGLSTSLTPLADWTAYPKARSYAFILQHGGRTIDLRYTRKTQYQFPNQWRYDGAYHAFGHRQVYVIYVYAYTSGRPSGFLIGHASWTIS